MDGWVNIARCRISEGDITGAKEALEELLLFKRLLTDPNRAKVHYFYALALKPHGSTTKHSSTYKKRQINLTVTKK